MRERGEMNQKSFFLFIFLIISLALAPSAYPIGIGSFTREIRFSPGLNTNIEAFVVNNVGTDIRVKLEARGDLAEYVSFSEEYLEIPTGQKYFFTFNLNLPESIRPGRNRLEIGGIDVTPPPPPPGGGIRAVTSAYKVFWVEAPYPGKYIEASFSANDIEKDGTAVFSINAVNKGTEEISRLGGIISIFYGNDRIADLSLKPEQNIKPYDARTLSAEWDSKGNDIGKYAAKAELTYDGNELELETGLRIGALLVRIINYTREAYKDEINQFDIVLESLWNLHINDAYAEAEIGSHKIKTLKADLAPWSRTKLTTYLDTANLDEGEHILKIRAYYPGNFSEETGTLTVLPKREKGIIIELPSKIPSVTALLIAIIVLLVIGNVILALYYLRGNGKGAKARKRPAYRRKGSGRKRGK